MGAEEGMDRRGEHRISIVDNASGSGGRVGTEIDQEEVSSLPINSNEDEKWIRKLQEKVERAFPGSTHWPSQFVDETEPKICMFTMREEISRPRSVTKGEFSQPRVVRIGPFHRKVRTSISNNKKWMIVYFVNYLYRLDLAGCIIKIKNQVATARRDYTELDVLESFGLKDDNRFAKMLLLDSYFILFVLTVKIRKRPSGYTLMPTTPDSARLLNLFRDDTTEVLDIIFHKDEIAPDLLIFDNQIPFFVIEELFKELKWNKPLHEYALEFFRTIHPRPARHCIDEDSPPKFLHLLDLFHWSRVPKSKYIELSSSSKQLDSIDLARRSPNAMEPRETATMFGKKKPRQQDSINWARHTPNAMELTESATLFEKKTSGSSLDITFRRRWFKRIGGVLDIPELHIRDYSSFIFHNLIAFEMQSSSRGRCTMAFSVLMRNLLQSQEDVKLLRQRGILASSSITDRKLVNMFKRLSGLTESYQMPSDLCHICHRVQSHHNHGMSQFCGSVILKFFPNPLVTLSVFIAILLFVPTLLQTIYNTLKYYHR
ncbi:UPF0481 protein At3g47200-like isoform X1 [Ananas comosus]|nr:UPF0481 protein At3g47200-like isoform X1 [Ananas comosus]